MLLKMGQGHTGARGEHAIIRACEPGVIMRALGLCAAVRGGLLTSERPVQRAWMSRESAPRLMIGFDESAIAAGKCFLNTATARASSPRSSALAAFEAMILFLFEDSFFLDQIECVKFYLAG